MPPQTAGFALEERWQSNGPISTKEAGVDLTSRRRGLRLVVAGALVGAVAGATLGLAVQGAERSKTVAMPAHDPGASAVAPSPPAGRPQASGVSAPRPQAGGGGSFEQRGKPADRPGRGGRSSHGGKHGSDRPGERGKSKHK